MKVPSLESLPLQNAKVLVRVDFNVPLDPQGGVLDDTRIVAALPTIRYLLSQGCRVILMSHLGRPKGAATPEFSLKPVSAALSHLLNVPVKMAPDCIGPKVEAIVSEMQPGAIVLLENLRFHPAEEKPEKDPTFARQLARLADFYVDDAFGAAHRAHASVVEVPKWMKRNVAAGLLLNKEINFLGQALHSPLHPFMALIGGAKVSSKIGVLRTLLEKIDILAIGGGMAFTFLKALGHEVGGSLIELDQIAEALAIMDLCKKKEVTLLLPVDVVAAKEVTDEAEAHIYKVQEGIPQDEKGLDIGPKTILLFNQAMKQAQTILWNGPMGVFERKPFSRGTFAIAEAFAKTGAVTIAGGGETVAALQSTPWKDQVTHLSTGGGATLEFLEFGTLPGIEALYTGST